MMRTVQMDLFNPSSRARKPPPAKEFATHCMVADTLKKFCRPSWRYTHIPNGEKRDKATAAKLKRMGVQPGWPDFALIDPGGGFRALELKRKGEHLTEDQEAFRDFCITAGVPYKVAWSYSQAIDVLNDWNVFKTRIQT